MRVIARPSLPPVPAPPEPPAFPLLGALAPVLVAAVLFAVTRSPAVLLFAVFSPVLAVAAVVDGRLQARRRARRASRRRVEEIDAIEVEVDALLSARAAEAHRRAPGAGVLAAELSSAAEGRAGAVVLGTADLATEPVLDGRPADERERALLARASRLPGAPVVVPAGCGVTVAGLEPFAGAARRAVTAQRPRDSGAGHVLMTLHGPATAVVDRATGDAAHLLGLTLAPGFLTAASAAALAAAADGTAVVAPIGPLLDEPPAAGGLAALFLLADGSPLAIDLPADGPHAVVAGTTGSGKSALLTAWILALAAAHPPATLALLLIDCKGGAAFDPLAALPHVTGVLTDLDHGGAARAVTSLRAELARRERALRDRGAADARGSGEPRLVVVVDEFRALLEAGPELAAVFTDVAARGRSLGVHLVLCTQRPAGTVRDDLMANCGLRIALRVHDAADSVAVVGSDAAARIDRGRVGAAVMVVAGERARPVRVARVDAVEVPALVRSVAARHAGSTPSPPCWLPPLPARLPADAVDRPTDPAGGVVLGLLDVPEEQAQPPLVWDPRRRPRLVVVGDAGSGRSTALASIAVRLGTTVAATDPATAWDRLHDDTHPLVVDDLERLLDGLGPQHAPAAIERLIRRMRAGDSPVVLAIRAPSAWGGAQLRPLVGLADELLMLGTGLDDHLALGGSRSTWRPAPHPGSATWHGRAAQVALAAQAARRDVAVGAPPLDPFDETAVLLTAAPDRRAVQLRAAGFHVSTPGSPQAVPGGVCIGGPQAWQGQWSRLGAAAATGTVLVDRIEAVDLRTLLGVREVLPPLSHPDEVVVLRPGRPPERRRLPTPAVSASR